MELVRLAPLPGLLNQLTPEEFDELSSETPAPRQPRPVRPTVSVPPARAAEPVREPAMMYLDEPASWPPFGDGVGGPPDGKADGPNANWHGFRRWWVMSGAAALVVLIVLSAVLLFVAPKDQGPPVAQPVTWSATDTKTGVRAWAQLIGQPWGTELRLRMEAVPYRKGTCDLVVRGKDGASELAGQWQAGYGSAADVAGRTSITIDNIERIDVMAPDGKLVDIERPS